MRAPVNMFLIGTLLLVPALTFGKTYVVPHVLERSGVLESEQSGTVSPPRQGTMPSVQEIQQMVEKKTGATIRWNPPIGKSDRRVKLTGTGTMGDNLTININCQVSYPPLSIRCTITTTW